MTMEEAILIAVLGGDLEAAREKIRGMYPNEKRELEAACEKIIDIINGDE